MTDIPEALMREVFGNNFAKKLLLFLFELEDTVRYSEARRKLGFHPQEFARALRTLESNGLVQRRSPKVADSEGRMRNIVYLEVSIMGKAFAVLWKEMSNRLGQIMAERNIPESALSLAAEG